MPGILPMKVIKVGTSSQSRIAQACDRCRSKKIRCDGIRPCCSQCANVGFECRTSDKLSRRAFPRGYTESLEERVRQLEAEVRELKDLLDEKDEKIDMLSKMHGNQRHTASAARCANTTSPSSGSATSASPSSTSASSLSDAASRQPASPVSSTMSPTSAASASSASLAAAGATAKSLSPRKSTDGIASAQAPKKEAKSPAALAQKEDTFRVQASPLVLGVENSDSYFMGASSGRSFIDTFKRRMQESGKSCADFHAEAFLHIQGCYPLVEKAPSSSLRIPPRLFSDRCVNVYFQEWSPLFPTLHRPAFLGIYDEFVGDADKVKNHHKLAQLYLVFAIAGLSSEQSDLEQVAACEQQWQRSLDAILMDNTIITLQCLVLAILYCSMRADYKRLQYYKGVAVGLSHRLGLHQSQKRFSFGALTIETRKKVFWTLYTLDCFSAAVLGLPKQLNDDDIHTEYPADTDDEYVTEKGFQPTLPGESTRLSAALALFRAARILAKVLDANYPAASMHELSLQRMAALDAELLEWRDALPQHLALTFRQEKPSTDVTGNRSPILSFAYYYIRTLIWRPAVGSSLGPKAAPAAMAVSEASKHMLQIVELLEERKMSFSLCLNMPDLLLICGMTLLYQSMDLKQDSKMMKDTERLVNTVIKIADRTKAPGCYDFARVAGLLVSVDDVPSAAGRAAAELSMAAPAGRRASPSGSAQRKLQQQQFGPGRHNSASMSETDLLAHQEKLRRMTMPAIAGAGGNSALDSETRARGRSSFDSPREHIQLPKQHRLSMSQAQMLGRASQSQHQHQRLMQKKKNLDFLNMAQTTQPASPAQPRLLPQPLYVPHSQKSASPSAVTPADWEALLNSMDGGHMNVYDAIYGGPNIGLPAAADTAPASATSKSGDGWSPESWDLSGFTLADLVSTTGQTGPPPAQSVLSFSDESMSSVAGDDLASADLANLGLGGLDISGLPYRSSNGLPNSACGAGAPEGYGVESMGNSYAL